jgi:DNA repair protein RAD16
MPRSAKKGATAREETEEKPVVLESQQTAPSYLVEIAKTGRSTCKKCDSKIDNKVIRIGVVIEGSWGLSTSWQHLGCTIFHKSLRSTNEIEGYNELQKTDQESVGKRFMESQNEVDLEMEDLNPDELVRTVWKNPMEPHSDLLLPLLPYQKEGLGWMIHQESSEVHGGILADEMGMVSKFQVIFNYLINYILNLLKIIKGKTIQAIALILTNRPSRADAKTLAQWDASDLAHEFKTNSNSSQQFRGGTLIVLPTVAIRQWQMEISRFTRENALTVKVYHGSDRTTNVKDLLLYDVIITSYKVMINIYLIIK